ncbi:choice-of-anchor I family protein [Pengzhenrongella sicca]|uniref:choice-of-anchor I family protein n=1 Tax=Pengzhenrongella sicca TaxID=2819238 RepID=UPI001D0C8F60|nr:choice-of-anchor I family protein [Pengzhenrongella sicca]
MTGFVPASAAVVDDPSERAAADAAFALVPLGSYETGVFDESAAEIVAFHAESKRLFTVNAAAGIVDVLDAAKPAHPTKLAELVTAGTPSQDGSTVPVGAVANSVAVRQDGLGVIAVESVIKTEPGWLVFFDAGARNPRALGAVRVGALPDMVALGDKGRVAVVANEGEPSEDYSVDPEGSVSLVSLPRGIRVPKQSAVRTADFHAFEAAGALADGVRVFGPEVNTGFPVSANLEPEYVAIEGMTAYVTLQEANAIAVVDLQKAKVSAIWPLGAKDHGVSGQGLDPSDRDGAVNIRAVAGLQGLYMPDAIAAYEARGRSYLVTANEGDAREWGDYAEPARVKDLGSDGLAPICAGSPLAALTGDADLGRLNVTTASGLNADGTCYEDLYAFGARSFSIWDTQGRLVFDSGDLIEQITAQVLPEFFNTNHTESALEGRSDDKGPEPEGIAIGEVRGRTYAFIGLERVGGVMAFDITRPSRPVFVTYVNNRNFAVSVEEDGAETLPTAGDLGPEGLTFISASASPTRQPMLAVANEVSGTTTLFRLDLARRGGH